MRRNPRAPGYPYRAGGYLITICVHGRQRILSEIIKGEIYLSSLGEVVSKTWDWVNTVFPHVIVDEYVVMPDHTHAIITITDDKTKLANVVMAFKRETQKTARAFGIEGRLWQERYHDHVVRNIKDFERCRKYVSENPVHWSIQHGEIL